jgi:hypothetical protein
MLPLDCEITEFVKVVLFFHTAILPTAPVPERLGVAWSLWAESWAEHGITTIMLAVTVNSTK